MALLLLSPVAKLEYNSTLRNRCAHFFGLQVVKWLLRPIRFGDRQQSFAARAVQSEHW
jgi:hypothetical protein